MDLTALEKVLLLSTAILMLSDVGLLAIIRYLWRLRNSGTPLPCSSVSCVSTASNLLQHMNLSVDPCIDFYDFACGKFLQEANIPDDATVLSTFTILSDEIDDKLRVALVGPYHAETPKYELLAKKYYRYCMDLDDIEEGSLKPIMKMLGRRGGWPMISPEWDPDCCDLGSTLGILMRMGSGGLINFDVGLDPFDSSNAIAYIEQGSLTFPSDFYKNPKHQGMIEALSDFIKETALFLSQDRASAGQINKDVKDLIDFEKALAEIRIPSKKRNRHVFTNKTLDFLKTTFENDLDFEAFYTKLFSPYQFKNFSVSILGISDLPYFEGLARLIKRTKKRTIYNYLLWKAILKFSIVLPREFRDIEIKFLSFYKGVTEIPARWVACLSQMKEHLFAPLSALYVKHYFSGLTKAKAEELVDEMINSMRTLIKGVGWLQQETKDHALEKLGRMRQLIGHPDFYEKEDPYKGMFSRVAIQAENFLELIILAEKVNSRHKIHRLTQPVDYQKLAIRFAAVDAFYSPIYNLIVFPAGMLQYPFYSVGSHTCLNFGGIGHVVGHELSHGFDRRGKYYDKNGKSNLWWSQNDEDMFGRVSQCFVDQYNHFHVPGLGEKVNGKLTLSENIADNGGVRGAFMAYKNWMKKNGEELKLPGLDLNPEQLFFLNVGRVHCSKKQPDGEAAQLKAKPHTPPKFRVNGPLMNMDEFAITFNCPLGSPMNPRKKCRVW